MKVEELSQYGKTLSGLPRQALEKQKQIVFREMSAKFGLLGMVTFFLELYGARERLRKDIHKRIKKH